jgi:hypothetical protein
MSFVVLFLVVWVGTRTIAYQGKRTRKQRHLSGLCPHPPVYDGELAFEGFELDLPGYEIHEILMDRLPYYRSLKSGLQRRFRYRLQLFMQGKKFIIREERGKREMPVLISAAAIQITFGLPYFRLPFYRYICIYPKEYIVLHRLTILKGNVEDNVITIAWSHLLHGFDVHDDGKNVALHEMSHALYIQKMVIEENYAKRFRSGYQHLMDHCYHAFQLEAKGEKDLYTEYANKDLQEFWAESVELFFEKPEALYEHYPDVYQALIHLLQQDPRHSEHPILGKKPSVKETLSLVKDVLTS